MRRITSSDQCCQGGGSRGGRASVARSAQWNGCRHSRRRRALPRASKSGASRGARRRAAVRRHLTHCPTERRLIYVARTPDDTLIAHLRSRGWNVAAARSAHELGRLRETRRGVRRHRRSGELSAARSGRARSEPASAAGRLDRARHVTSGSTIRWCGGWCVITASTSSKCRSPTRRSTIWSATRSA